MDCKGSGFMVIVRISGGMGNQLFQYAAGRQLAHKLNTELKLDVVWYKNNRMAPYTLDQFNTIGTIATPEEIEPLKKICMNTGLGKEGYDPIQKVLNYPDNIYLDGDWCSERYFPDIRNLLLKEITLKNPLSPNSEALKHKILSAKCAVSLHFRHGDFLYNPVAGDKPWFHIPPFEYYYNCINTLKQVYKDLTVFVFSNNMEWVKENLHLDVPTEFVEGRQENKRFNDYSKRDIEEMYLMSLCKHNINPRSAFSWWGAYLNQNPDKKVFVSTSATAQDTLKYKYSLTTDEKSPLESGKWIYVPFDRDKQPKVVMRPIYSLLLVVNDDAATIADTLNRILGQDYKYYEVIIIDNASTDGSGQICQQVIAGKANVTFKKLWAKVKNAEAWNIALDMAQGYYISFLKGNDRFMPNTLSMLYLTTHWQQPDFVHSFAWLAENDKGNIAFGNKKCTEQRDVQFVTAKSSVVDTEGQNAIKLLLNRQINNFLGTKLYNRNFLLENEIKFDEHFDEYEAELYFQMECFFKSKYFMYVPNAFYVASKNALEQYLSLGARDNNKVDKVDDYDAQIIRKFSRYFTARVDIRLVPKTAGGDFQILSVSDDKATIRKNVGWLTKGDNIGHVISSYVGQLEFVVKSTAGGRIRLRLRGLDVRTPEDKTKRIPYWVDYTKFIVNGTTIFDQITPAWHDKFYNYEMDAKAGEEVKVQVEWLPHIDNAIDEVVAPTPKPAVAPTPKPAVAPTPKPAVAPTPKPAVAPTPKPAVAPTPKLAVAPTPKPAVAPTPKPAVAPTPKPAVAPTPKPAVAPTPKPAVAPTPKPAVAPTPKPAVAPTPKPAVAPTPKPAVAPTPKPAVAPTPKPAVAPTPKPAVAPTPKPAVAPTPKLAVAPTPKPAVAPTPKPAVAPTPKPAVAKEVDMRIVTGRLDIQLVPITKGGDFQILSISDDKATVWKPGWFQQDGIGYQIQSYAGKLEFIAKATVNGQIRLYVKGLDVRDPKDNSKRVPYWIDFTKLIVNGKVIFDKLTPAWHDKPYVYNMEVKSGEEVKIQVEWLPHKSDT